MAEVKEFRHLLEQIQQMPDTQNLGQSQERWEEMEQKSQWMGQLAEQIFQKYSGSFVTPRIPESDPPAPILQAALEYMNNQKNYSSLLQPGLFRKVQEADYQNFLTYAEAAKRYYHKQAQILRESAGQKEQAWSALLEQYSAAAQEVLTNTTPQQEYRPAGSGSTTLYLGDIEEPAEYELPLPEGARWLDEDWARIPFHYKTTQPFTLFIDAPDNREFDTLQKRTGQILRGLMYQIIRAMPAYSYRFLVIDLKKSAGFLEELQVLARVINGSAYVLNEEVCRHRYQMLKTATTSEQASQMLRELDEWLGKVTALCAGESSLVSYNQARMKDGAVMEGQHIVPQTFVILNNIHGMGNVVAATARRLIENAAQCGVSTILLSGRTREEPLDKEEEQLKQIVSDWMEMDEEDCIVELSAASLGEPKTKEIRRSHLNFSPWTGVTADPNYLEAIRASLRPSVNIETAMEKRLDLDALWGKSDGASEIVLPVGVNEHGKVTTIAIGGPDGAHALLAGSTGCGKSTLLHDIINGVIAFYKPTDVQLWLADYKLNEFQRYAEDTPPHVKFIGISRSMEYSLGFIEKIHSEMEHRQQLFGKITSLKEYRETYGEDSMPRILIVIDEFHKMSDHVRDNPEHKQMLTNILKEARSVGISLLLSDQTCGIGLKGLSEEGKEQLTLRMSMRSSYDEYNAVMGISNAREVRELKALRRWEVTLKRVETFENDEGEEEVRSYFEWNRTLYLSNEIREQIARRSIQEYGPCTDVQVVRSGVRIRPDWEDVVRSAPSAKPRTLPIYLGVPTSLDKYLSLSLRMNFEENILCIGDDDIRLLSVMESVLQSVRCAGRPYKAYVLIDEYEPMYYEGETWLHTLARKDSAVELCIGEEEVCRAVAQLDQMVQKRMRQRTGKEQIFVFWIGLAGLIQSLSMESRRRPADLLADSAPTHPAAPKATEESKASEPAAEPSDPLDRSMSELEKQFEALFGSSFSGGEESAEEAPAPEDGDQRMVYNISDDVQEIVRMGPRQGVCSVVFHSSVSMLKRTPCARQDDFRHRIGFGLGTDDAILFLNSSKAIKDAEGNLIDESMAVYFDGRSYRQFAPFIGELEEGE